MVDAPDRLTAPGQTYVQVGKLLGKRYRSTWTVLEIEAGHRIRSEGELGAGVHYCLTQVLTGAAPGRSRLQIVLDYTLPGGPLGPLAARAGVESRASQEAQSVLDGIRRVIEQG